MVPVRVHARGSRSEIQGVRNGTVHVKTTAPPLDGKANEDVIRQLAREFGVSPSHVFLQRGAAARDKIFVISHAEILPSWIGEVSKGPAKLP